MKDSWQSYLQLGIVHFMAFPDCLSGDGPQFDTLSEIRAERGPAQPLVFLLGSDAFGQINTWHRWEELFDLDYPGHYFRRIKSVSLTLPCVAGPYTNISCTMRLLKNSLRINTGDADNAASQAA